MKSLKLMGKFTPLSGEGVTVHIGSHRTGTGSFQEYLRRHCADAASSSVDVLCPPMSREKNSYVGIEKLSANISDFIKRTDYNRSKFGRPCVISDESYMGGISENLIKSSAYFSLPRRLSVLNCAIPQGADICLTIRDYTEWWESQIIYGLRFKAEHTLTEDKLFQMVCPPRGWIEVVEDIARAFPSSRLRVWDFKSIVGSQRTQLERFSNSQAVYSLPEDPIWRNKARSGMSRNILKKIEQFSPERAAHFGSTGRLFYGDEISEMKDSYQRDTANLRDYMQS